jgi:hypothetical protein
MDTYLSLHNFFLLPSFVLLFIFFFTPVFTIHFAGDNSIIQLLFCSQFSLCRGHLSAKHFYILSLIPFFFNVTDSLHYHGYRTLLLHFRSKQHLYKYFFWNKKSKHTSFLHLRLTTTVLKAYLHLFDNKSFQDALMSISSPDCIL